MRNAYDCPHCGNDFYESDEPFFEGEHVECPHCGEYNQISGGFRNSKIQYGIWKIAKLRGFKLLRTDRGAIEVVATRKTMWPKDVLAFTQGQFIFWPNVKASKNQALFKHEMCHVRQGKKHGDYMFPIKYMIEHVLSGYNNNKFEISAERAERRKGFKNER